MKTGNETRKKKGKEYKSRAHKEGATEVNCQCNRDYFGPECVFGLVA